MPAFLRVIPLLLIITVLGLSLPGCPVRYVADYDAEVKTEILRIAKEVDIFWGDLLDTPESDRDYDNFKNDYNRIEADIRNLLLRNQVRSLNELSVQQTEKVLELWEDDKAKHKEKNTFPDFLARSHRQQYTRLFVALAKGEEAKNAESGDGQ